MIYDGVFEQGILVASLSHCNIKIWTSISMNGSLLKLKFIKLDVSVKLGGNDKGKWFFFSIISLTVLIWFKFPHTVRK